jgi:hypothetical protein
MKKLVAVGAVAAALTLSGCGAGSNQYDIPNIPLSYQMGPAGSDTDWDLDHTSVWNNQTYCNNGTYNPMSNGRYTCTTNGVVSAPLVRPSAPVMPPKIVEQAKAEQTKKIDEAKKVSEQKKAADKAAADKKASEQKKSSGSTSSNSGSKSSSTSSGSKSSSSSSSSKK